MAPKARAKAVSTRTAKMETRSGRHPLLVPFVRKAVLDAVARGAPVALAAQSAGIAPRTLDRAMTLGRAGDPRYAALIDEMATARAQRGRSE